MVSGILKTKLPINNLYLLLTIYELRITSTASFNPSAKVTWGL